MTTDDARRAAVESVQRVAVWNKYGTPFTETEALLAALQEDEGYLEQLLEGLLPEERKLLDAACLSVLGHRTAGQKFAEQWAKDHPEEVQPC